MHIHPTFSESPGRGADPNHWNQCQRASPTENISLKNDQGDNVEFVLSLYSFSLQCLSSKVSQFTAASQQPQLMTSRRLQVSGGRSTPVLSWAAAPVRGHRCTGGSRRPVSCISRRPILSSAVAGLDCCRRQLHRLSTPLKHTQQTQLTLEHMRC